LDVIILKFLRTVETPSKIDKKVYNLKLTQPYLLHLTIIIMVQQIEENSRMIDLEKMTEDILLKIKQLEI